MKTLDQKRKYVPNGFVMTESRGQKVYKEIDAGLEFRNLGVCMCEMIAGQLELGETKLNGWLANHQEMVYFNQN